MLLQKCYIFTREITPETPPQHDGLICASCFFCKFPAQQVRFVILRLFNGWRLSAARLGKTWSLVMDWILMGLLEWKACLYNHHIHGWHIVFFFVFFYSNAMVTFRGEIFSHLMIWQNTNGQNTIPPICKFLDVGFLHLEEGTRLTPQILPFFMT